MAVLKKEESSSNVVQQLEKETTDIPTKPIVYDGDCVAELLLRESLSNDAFSKDLINKLIIDNLTLKAQNNYLKENLVRA